VAHQSAQLVKVVTKFPTKSALWIPLQVVAVAAMVVAHQLLFHHHHQVIYQVFFK